MYLRGDEAKSGRISIQLLMKKKAHTKNEHYLAAKRSRLLSYQKETSWSHITELLNCPENTAGIPRRPLPQTLRNSASRLSSTICGRDSRHGKFTTLLITPLPLQHYYIGFFFYADFLILCTYFKNYFKFIMIIIIIANLVVHFVFLII